jgi:hypothetical protein
MMKLRFHCVNNLSDKHDKDIDLTDLILWPCPTCCGAEMHPVDETEWRRISRVLGRVNIELQHAGLPTLAGMLMHTEGRPV